MLMEIFVVSEAGIPVYHKNFTKTKIDREPTLISAFITATQGFSQETFNSRFKRMEFDAQSVYLIFNKVYIIGIFSYDELSAAAFRLLNIINAKFNEKYTEQDYLVNNLDLDDLVIPIVESSTIIKYSPQLFGLSFIVILISSLLYYPITSAFGSNELVGFYSWVSIVLLGSIICGRIVSQRWVAIIVSFFYTFLPSFIVLFSSQLQDKFVFSDYTAFFVMIPWTLTAYSFERKYIHNTITPKIPVLWKL